jgi:hypothetical protein
MSGSVRAVWLYSQEDIVFLFCERLRSNSMCKDKWGTFLALVSELYSCLMEEVEIK